MSFSWTNSEVSEESEEHVQERQRGRVSHGVSNVSGEVQDLVVVELEDLQVGEDVSNGRLGLSVLSESESHQRLGRTRSLGDSDDLSRTSDPYPRILYYSTPPLDRDGGVNRMAGRDGVGSVGLRERASDDMIVVGLGWVGFVTMLIAYYTTSFLRC